MKKILIILICFVSAGFGRAAAQADMSGVKLDEIVLSLEDGRVLINFSVRTDKSAVAGRYYAELTPVLTDGGNRAELPIITVYGKKAMLCYRRMTAGRGNKAGGGYSVIAGQTVRYTVGVDYEPWMAGADFKLDVVVAGCNSVAETEPEVIAQNLLIGDTVRIVKVTEPPAVKKPETVADRQASKYTFVAPLIEFEKARTAIVDGEDFDENMLLHLGKAVGPGKQVHVEKFIERYKPGSLTVYFDKGRREIDERYRGNAPALERLKDAVRTIESSEDSRVMRVVIAGFASPEGALSHNDKLAWDRALAVRKYLTDNTRLAEDKIRIFNGSEDWLGLRRMVEVSDMPEKAEVIRIIDFYSREYEGQGYGRLWRLKNLNGGSTYRYLYENYFPDLRNAAYIKVYYENIE